MRRIADSKFQTRETKYVSLQMLERIQLTVLLIFLVEFRFEVQEYKEIENVEEEDKHHELVAFLYFLERSVFLKTNPTLLLRTLFEKLY